jgi:uncharacterized protein YidB (DUF937 family)
MNAAEQTLSEAVLEVVAETEGVDPSELSEPLFSVIDPDALDALFQTSNGILTFSYHGHVITVEASGKVRVESGG